MRHIILSPWTGFAAFFVGIAVGFALPSGPLSDWTWFVLAVICALLVYAVGVWVRATLEAFRTRARRKP